MIIFCQNATKYLVTLRFVTHLARFMYFGLDRVQIGLRLGSDWVQIGFRSGSDQVQIRFGSGSDRVKSYMKSLKIELGYEI